MSAAKTVQTTLLAQNGEFKSVAIPCKGLTPAVLKKAIKSKADLELLGTYEFPPLTIYMYGAIDGKPGTENEHDLPPPHDNLLIFGDIIAIASQNKDPSVPEPFIPSNYEKFSEYIYEGEEDSDDADDVSEEDGALEDDEAGANEDEEVPVPDEDEVDAADEDVPVLITQPITRKKGAAKLKNIPSIMSSPDFKELNEKDEDDPLHVRQNTRQIIQKLLPELDATLLEHAIFKVSLTECELETSLCVAHWKNPLYKTTYLTVCRRVIGNLRSYVNNNRLLERLRGGEFTYDEMAAKNYYELFPETWKELSDKQIMRETRLLEGNKGMATDQFKCHGCGKRECTFYEMQTRSADEPMTIFITCVNCGKRWRQ